MPLQNVGWTIRKNQHEAPVDCECQIIVFMSMFHVYLNSPIIKWPCPRQLLRALTYCQSISLCAGMEYFFRIWWRHDMKTFPVLRDLCWENLLVTKIKLYGTLMFSMLLDEFSCWKKHPSWVAYDWDTMTLEVHGRKMKLLQNIQCVKSRVLGERISMSICLFYQNIFTWILWTRMECNSDSVIPFLIFDLLCENTAWHVDDLLKAFSPRLVSQARWGWQINLNVIFHIWY